MFSKLFTVGLIGVAAAAVYETETEEEVEAWTLSGSNDVNVDSTSRLIARVEAIESAANPTTTAVQMAQTSMGRLDAIVDEVADLKLQLATDISRLTNTASLTGSENGLDWHKNRVVQKKWEIPASGRTARSRLVAKITAAKAKVQAKSDEVANTMATRMAAMENKIDDAMEAVIANAAFTGSDDHIEQVCGFRPDDVDEYWDKKVYTSSADHGEVRGRKFYRVHFNKKQPGFFTSGSDELFMACRALSVYMQRQDGLERDLRPACNTYYHHRFGGLGQCIWIHRSYFSHCGGGGYWRQNMMCAGVPETALRNIPHYEDNQHNWDRHLAHYDRENHHGWVDPYRTSQYQHTLCTGGNQNYKADFSP
jgi:hypothetical protein